MTYSRYARLLALATAMLLMIIATPAAFARGSFGRGGGFGGGGFGHSFGGGSFRSPSRSYSGGGGHSFFGGLFGHSRPSAPTAPRPSFTTPPRAEPPSPGSFGRAGTSGSPTSSHFAPSAATGGSFNRTGAAGRRAFSSVGEHPQPAAPTNIGTPFSPGLAHPYYYRGRPAPAYFSGGFTDYSYGYLGHPYYGWLPWSPVFYYNRPYYANGGYVSGGFSFIRFLIGIVFWIVVAVIMVNLFRWFRGRRVQ